MRGIICAFTISILLSFGFTAASARAETLCFALREEGGKIALYREDIAEPLAVYDAPPGGLTAADEELLSEGVRFKTQAEVMRLLEDLDVSG